MRTESPDRNRSVACLRAAGPALAGVALAFALTTPVHATSYYVEPPPTGDDSNPGSEASPWATLQHAAGEVGPGDLVYARAGDYAGFEISTSGEAASPITFRNYPGEEARVVSQGPRTGVGINVESCSYVVIEGFTVQNQTNYGIRAVAGDGITLRGNRILQAGKSGILAGYVEDFLAEDNQVEGAGIEAAILLLDESSDVTLRGNALSGHVGGIYFIGFFDGGNIGIFTGVTVENNIIRSAPTGTGLNLIGVQDAMVRNNLLAAMPRFGILVWNDGAGGASTGNRFLNNTVVSTATGWWAFYALNASTGTELSNNIFLHDGATFGSVAFAADSLTGLQSDHNLAVDRFSVDDGTTTISLAAWRIATGQDASTNLSSSAATFLDSASGNYHLQNPGPAIDSGLTLVDVPADLEGVLRPQGAAFDIGAYEWTAHLFSDSFESGGVDAWSSSTVGP